MSTISSLFFYAPQARTTNVEIKGSLIRGGE